MSTAAKTAAKTAATAVRRDARERDEAMTSDSTSDTSAASRDGERVEGTRRRLQSPERLVALSDGVFAIILTLLVLEIAVPPNLSHDSLGQVLEELRPTAVAWVISFLITGMYWVSHRDLFARVRVVNRDLVWLNLLFLLPASLIPFAASLLGEYPDEAKALQIYGVVMIAVAIMRLVMFRYVVRRPALLFADEVGEHRAIGFALGAIPIVIYGIAMVVAEVRPSVSVFLFFSVPLLYFLAVTLLRERKETRDEAEEFS